MADGDFSESAAFVNWTTSAYLFPEAPSSEPANVSDRFYTSTTDLQTAAEDLWTISRVIFVLACLLLCLISNLTILLSLSTDFRSSCRPFSSSVLKSSGFRHVINLSATCLTCALLSAVYIFYLLQQQKLLTLTQFNRFHCLVLHCSTVAVVNGYLYGYALAFADVYISLGYSIRHSHIFTPCRLSVGVFCLWIFLIATAVFPFFVDSPRQFPLERLKCFVETTLSHSCLIVYTVQFAVGIALAAVALSAVLCELVGKRSAW